MILAPEDRGRSVIEFIKLMNRRGPKIEPEVPLRRPRQGWKILHLGQHVDICFGDSLSATVTGDHKHQYEQEIALTCHEGLSQKII